MKPEFSSEGNPYQKPETQRIWSTIFLKMGGLSPALSKMGGRVPPVPPCGGAPGTQVPMVPTTGTQVHTYAAAQRHCQPPCEPACDRGAKPFSIPCTEAPTQRVPCEKRFPRFATRPSLTASFNVHIIPKIGIFLTRVPTGSGQNLPLLFLGSSKKKRRRAAPSFCGADIILSVPYIYIVIFANYCETN